MVILHSMAFNPSLHFRVMSVGKMQLSYKVRVYRNVLWLNTYCQGFRVAIDGAWIGNQTY
jgi:hypothetical protein